MDTRTQQFYTLLAGRWFRAKSLEGSWEWVPGEKLPRDFSRIAPESAKGHVLASIPGTEQAREAVIADQIPQTATVRRSEARLDVHYDGEPQFQPIEGTQMEYAVNTSSEVIHARDATTQCSTASGSWPIRPLGPWSVADMIPPGDLYHPAELSALSCALRVRLWCDSGVCVRRATRPATWEHLSTTAWWCLAPVGGIRECLAETIGAAGPGPGESDSNSAIGAAAGSGIRWVLLVVSQHALHTPDLLRTLESALGHSADQPNQAWIRGNVNAYSHWGGNAVVARNFEQRGGAVSQRGGARPDLYAGRDGQVYQHRSDGWYQQNRSGQWQRMPSNPRRLEQQRDSRSLGQSRQGEFQNRGQSPGIPRTVMPPSRPSMPSRPAAPPPRGGRGRG